MKYTPKMNSIIKNNNTRFPALPRGSQNEDNLNSLSNNIVNNEQEADDINLINNELFMVSLPDNDDNSGKCCILIRKDEMSIEGCKLCNIVMKTIKIRTGKSKYWIRMELVGVSIIFSIICISCAFLSGAYLLPKITGEINTSLNETEACREIIDIINKVDSASVRLQYMKKVCESTNKVKRELLHDDDYDKLDDDFYVLDDVECDKKCEVCNECVIVKTCEYREFEEDVVDMSKLNETELHKEEVRTCVLNKLHEYFSVYEDTHKDGFQQMCNVSVSWDSNMKKRSIIDEEEENLSSMSIIEKTVYLREQERIKNANMMRDRELDISSPLVVLYNRKTLNINNSFVGVPNTHMIRKYIPISEEKKQAARRDNIVRNRHNEFLIERGKLANSSKLDAFNKYKGKGEGTFLNFVNNDSLVSSSVFNVRRNNRNKTSKRNSYNKYLTNGVIVNRIFSLPPGECKGSKVNVEGATVNILEGCTTWTICGYINSIGPESYFVSVIAKTQDELDKVTDWTSRLVKLFNGELDVLVDPTMEVVEKVFWLVVDPIIAIIRWSSEDIKIKNGVLRRVDWAQLGLGGPQCAAIIGDKKPRFLDSVKDTKKGAFDRVKRTGKIDYIRNGGESNPGPIQNIKNSIVLIKLLKGLKQQIMNREVQAGANYERMNLISLMKLLNMPDCENIFCILQDEVSEEFRELKYDDNDVTLDKVEEKKKAKKRNTDEEGNTEKQVLQKTGKRDEMIERADILISNIGRMGKKGKTDDIRSRISSVAGYIKEAEKRGNRKWAQVLSRRFRQRGAFIDTILLSEDVIIDDLEMVRFLTEAEQFTSKEKDFEDYFKEIIVTMSEEDISLVNKIRRNRLMHAMNGNIDNMSASLFKEVATVANKVINDSKKGVYKLNSMNNDVGLITRSIFNRSNYLNARIGHENFNYREPLCADYVATVEVDFIADTGPVAVHIDDHGWQYVEVNRTNNVKDSFSVSTEASNIMLSLTGQDLTPLTNLLKTNTDLVSGETIIGYAEALKLYLMTAADKFDATAIWLKYYMYVSFFLSPRIPRPIFLNSFSRRGMPDPNIPYGTDFPTNWDWVANREIRVHAITSECFVSWYLRRQNKIGIAAGPNRMFVGTDGPDGIGIIGLNSRMRDNMADGLIGLIMCHLAHPIRRHYNAADVLDMQYQQIQNYVQLPTDGIQCESNKVRIGGSNHVLLVVMNSSAGEDVLWVGQGVGRVAIPIQGFTGGWLAATDIRPVIAEYLTGNANVDYGAFMYSTKQLLAYLYGVGKSKEDAMLICSGLIFGYPASSVSYNYAEVLVPGNERYNNIAGVYGVNDLEVIDSIYNTDSTGIVNMQINLFAQRKLTMVEVAEGRWCISVGEPNSIFSVLVAMQFLTPNDRSMENRSSNEDWLNMWYCARGIAVLMDMCSIEFSWSYELTSPTDPEPSAGQNRRQMLGINCADDDISIKNIVTTFFTNVVFSYNNNILAPIAGIPSCFFFSPMIGSLQHVSTGEIFNVTNINMHPTGNTTNLSSLNVQNYYPANNIANQVQLLSQAQEMTLGEKEIFYKNFRFGDLVGGNYFSLYSRSAGAFLPLALKAVFTDFFRTQLAYYGGGMNRVNEKMVVEKKIFLDSFKPACLDLTASDYMQPSTTHGYSVLRDSSVVTRPWQLADSSVGNPFVFGSLKESQCKFMKKMKGKVSAITDESGMKVNDDGQDDLLPKN
jgi:hypothetical protein